MIENVYSDGYNHRSPSKCRSDLVDVRGIVATTACDVLPEAQPLVASPGRAAKALEILG
jgi:hypothetical protein